MDNNTPKNPKTTEIAKVGPDGYLFMICKETSIRNIYLPYCQIGRSLRNIINLQSNHIDFMMNFVSIKGGNGSIISINPYSECSIGSINIYSNTELPRSIKKEFSYFPNDEPKRSKLKELYNETVQFITSDNLYEYIMQKDNKELRFCFCLAKYLRYMINSKKINIDPDTPVNIYELYNFKPTAVTQITEIGDDYINVHKNYVLSVDDDELDARIKLMLVVKSIFEDDRYTNATIDVPKDTYSSDSSSDVSDDSSAVGVMESRASANGGLADDEIEIIYHPCDIVNGYLLSTDFRDKYKVQLCMNASLYYEEHNTRSFNVSDRIQPYTKAINSNLMNVPNYLYIDKHVYITTQQALLSAFSRSLYFFTRSIEIPFKFLLGNMAKDASMVIIETAQYTRPSIPRSNLSNIMSSEVPIVMNIRNKPTFTELFQANLSQLPSNSRKKDISMALERSLSVEWKSLLSTRVDTAQSENIHYIHFISKINEAEIPPFTNNGQRYDPAMCRKEYVSTYIDTSAQI